MTMTETTEVTKVIEMTWGELSQLASVSACASTDKMRPILTMIHLTSENGKVRAVATDSYTLAIIDTEVDAPSDLDVMVPATWLRDALKALKVARATEVPVTLSFTGTTITASNALTTVSTTNDVYGDYPKVTQLIPAEANYQSELGAFNAEFLARMSAILPAGRKDSPTWKCLSMSATSPSLWTRTYGTMSAQFLIMPVRVN